MFLCRLHTPELNVGAIGVAGGHYSKDEACVTAALEALEQMG